MDETKRALEDLMRSLIDAGRGADAQAVAKTIGLWQEVGQWIACLRCGMAFPTSEAHKTHYRKAHGIRGHWGGR